MNQRILHQDTSPAHHESATSSTAPATGTVRLTTAQALVRYLAAQRARQRRAA